MRSPQQQGRLWIYTCDRCGKCGPWSSSWAWFGSVIDFEEGRYERVFMSCSKKCRSLSRKEIASVSRGLAKCGPADMMQQLKDARSWQDEAVEQGEAIQALGKIISQARRIAYCALHVPGTNEEQALQEILRVLSVRKGSPHA